MWNFVLLMLEIRPFSSKNRQLRGTQGESPRWDHRFFFLRSPPKTFNCRQIMIDIDIIIVLKQISDPMLNKLP